MNTQDNYPPGAPCWVDTWQPDPGAATRFYGALLGWRFDESALEIAPTGGAYLTARLDGLRVAGIGQGPASGPAVWSMHVGVEDLVRAVERVQTAGGSRVIGPMSIGAEARSAVVADPAGIAFGLWQSDRRPGAELTGRVGTWAMSSLHTPDPERAAGFYGRLFGWELEAVAGAPFDRWQLGGRTVAVLTTTEDTAVVPHWSINVAVDDVDHATGRVTALGGTVLAAPFDAAGGRGAVVADPQGAVIALSTAPR